MRLPKVEHGHPLPRRILMRVARWATGVRVPDIVRTLWYRAPLFGKPVSAWTQAVMRGDSEWSVGERELFAAFTSRLNKCRF